MKDLSIIFPVHNEEKEIEKVIKNLYKEFKTIKCELEVLCIENGSTDNTGKVLEKLKKQYKNLFIYTSRKGWGNAVRKGIKKSKGKFICYMVSDGQVDLSYIALLYKEMCKKQTGMMKIYRVNRENLSRFIVSKIYNIFTTILFGIDSKDINATPKIIHSSFIKKKKFISKNIAFDVELLLYLKMQKVQWIEIPAFYKKRSTGMSTTNILSIIEMLAYLRIFYFQTKKRKK